MDLEGRNRLALMVASLSMERPAHFFFSFQPVQRSALLVRLDFSRYYDLPLEHGVLITKVTDESPAQKAGTLMGDIILQIDDTEIGSIEDLLTLIHAKKVGERVTIILFRRGFKQFFEAILSSMSPDRAL